MEKIINCMGMACPLPVVNAKKASEELQSGDVLTVLVWSSSAAFLALTTGRGQAMPLQSMIFSIIYSSCASSRRAETAILISSIVL